MASALLLLGVVMSVMSTSAASGAKPNIVLFLCDDMDQTLGGWTPMKQTTTLYSEKVITCLSCSVCGWVCMGGGVSMLTCAFGWVWLGGHRKQLVYPHTVREPTPSSPAIRRPSWQSTTAWPTLHSGRPGSVRQSDSGTASHALTRAILHEFPHVRISPLRSLGCAALRGENSYLDGVRQPTLTHDSWILPPLSWHSLLHTVRGVSNHWKLRALWHHVPPE
jgi:hypothetical protein